jgi:hypothetical protein
MDATGKWARRGVWLTLAAVLAIGCNPITLPFMLLRSEAKIPAQYPLRPKEGPKHDRDEEIKVLILASMSPGSATPDFVGSDRELAAAIARKLPEIGKENKEVYTVISPRQVDTFKTQNPGWKTMSAAKIGKKLGADYVIELSLGGLQLYQPGTNNLLYDGQAQVSVELTDTADPTAEPKRYVHSFRHPGYPRSADSMPPAQFKLEFMDKLARDLVFYHIEHKAAEGLAAR